MFPIPDTQKTLFEHGGRGNASLYFSRMTAWNEIGQSVKKSDNTIEILGVAINKRLASNADVLNRVHERQTEILKTTALQGGMVWELTATLSSPFVSGLGSGHPTETGFILDRNTGLPCIPASAIKGVLRLACGLHIEQTEPDSVKEQRDKNGQSTGQWEIPDTHPLFRRYFGDTDTGKKDSVRGQIAFLDAFPAALPQDGSLFKTDIMNPHFGKYYAGEQGPLETESPIPVKFLAVNSGVQFVFRCLALPLPARAADEPDPGVFSPFDEQDEKKVQALFEIACTQLGFGGKTSVGYGRFDAVETRNTAFFRERAQEEAAHRRQQAEEDAKRKLQEADDQLYPWKPWLREVKQIDSWNDLSRLVLENEALLAWLQEDGVFKAAHAAFLSVRNAAPIAWKKKDRQKIYDEWLAKHAPQSPDPVPPDNVEPIPEPSKPDADPVPPPPEPAKRIRAFKDYGDYINARINIPALTLPEAHALQEQFKKWGCHDKKAKGDKPKHWQALQKRLGELKEQGT